MPSRALVIGPAAYDEGSGLQSHPSIGASARAFGDALAQDALWGPDAVRVLDADGLRTVDSTMRALEQTADGTGPDDTLLVVYVGHGQYWNDVGGGQVHFSVGSSHARRPWTWLSSWYVYRAIRNSRARLKVLIADCCYSNLLNGLAGPDGEPEIPGVLSDEGGGACVFTAVGHGINEASAAACPSLPGALADCTPFSGHLLKVLTEGSTDHRQQLTLGILRETVRADLAKCQDAVHRMPKVIFTDAGESTPLFTNRMDAARRNPPPRLPSTPDEWIGRLLLDRDDQLETLLGDPRQTGKVVAHLTARDDTASRRLARHIDAKANGRFTDGAAFAGYWVEAEKAGSA